MNFGRSGLQNLKTEYEAKLGLDLATQEGLCFLTLAMARQISSMQESLKALRHVCDGILRDARSVGDTTEGEFASWKPVSSWQEYIMCAQSDSWKNNLVSVQNR